MLPPDSRHNWAFFQKSGQENLERHQKSWKNQKVLFTHIRNLVYSFSSMLSCMMSRHMDPKVHSELVRHTKIFLNRKHEFDRDMPSDNGMLDWSNKSNFLSLMNICESIPIIGPPLLYWEGGPNGEKAIQMLKPLIHGLVMNWQQNTLLRFYRGRVFENICHSLNVSQVMVRN